ncbi:hypothetical protein GCM10010295_14020 [Streptomyces intermedius]
MTPPWRTVVLSPHFDDAALSVAALVRRLPRPLTVVTVFGGPPPEGSPVSWWDTTCGFSSAAEAYACRRAEDARACALLEAEQTLLPNPDGPYGTAGPLRGLDALLTGLTPDTTVLVPLGTNQPDHERVRHQALAALDRPDGARTLVYADLPYTGHLPEWATDGASAALAASQKWGLAYQELTRRHPCAPSPTTCGSTTSSGPPNAPPSSATPPSWPRSPPTTAPSPPAPAPSARNWPGPSTPGPAPARDRLAPRRSGRGAGTRLGGR